MKRSTASTGVYLGLGSALAGVLLMGTAEVIDSETCTYSHAEATPSATATITAPPPTIPESVQPGVERHCAVDPSDVLLADVYRKLGMAAGVLAVGYLVLAAGDGVVWNRRDDKQ